MNKQKMIEAIKQEYMLKRVKNQEKCDEFLENLRKNDEFNQLFVQLSQKQLEAIKTELDGERENLIKDVVELKQKIDEFLVKNRIDKTKLTPKYDCPKCKDTGVFNGKICECLLNELNKKISIQSSSQSEFKSFENCDENIMNDNDKKVCAFLSSWCKKFPDISKININIIGGAGSGKTFFLECIANEMMKKNMIVCYKTAFELNELARLYHIGKSFEFADCINADILLIDDLGTEPVLKNVTKEYLYNLINTRQVNNRPTFISTNLSLENILSRYDERIFSRLGNKKLAINIQLDSKDKRL
ncbi:MAG: ATP-binding protein [Candidatus Onthoplasma sp.]